MNADFFRAIDDIEKEKGIPREYMLEKIKAAMSAAVRRSEGKDPTGGESNVFVDVNDEKQTIAMYLQKTVVEEVVSKSTEMSVEEAERYVPHPVVGDVVNIPLDATKFGRIAAQAAKQVIIQGIREAERNMSYNEYNSKEHELLTGVVTHIDSERGIVSVNISSNEKYKEAVLTPNECVNGEVLNVGDKIKVYVIEVRKGMNGPRVMISRTHPGLVKRLFELEVPEIYDGVVEIKNIVREPGSRTKMSVFSNQPEIEPVGACVGARGGRVSAVVEELRGEKIDIVRYSEDPKEYISAALAPSEVLKVELPDGEGSNRAVVTVPADQLSLAIGKEGQNVRLAAKLTGFKIDIHADAPAEQPEEPSDGDKDGSSEAGAEEEHEE